MDKKIQNLKQANNELSTQNASLKQGLNGLSGDKRNAVEKQINANTEKYWANYKIVQEAEKNVTELQEVEEMVDKGIQDTTVE